MKRKFAIVDTNVMLHSLPLNRIPWCDVIDADEVELVLVAQVLRELDGKKNGDSEKLKKRAKRVLGQINGWLPPGKSVATIAPNVTLRVHITEPAARAALDYTIGDDRILGSALEIASSAETTIITGDATMRFKAEHFGFSVVGVPEAYQPSETEPRREVRTEPKLVVGAFDASSTQPVTNIAVVVGVDVRKLLSDAESQLRIAKVQALEEARQRAIEAAEKDELLTNSPFRGLSRHSVVTRADLMRSFQFNSADRVIEEVTVESWERYVSALKAFDRDHKHVGRLELGIWNLGNAPAEQVSVEFQFPPTVAVSLREPVCPREPQERTMNDVMLSAIRSPRPTLSDETIELDDKTDVTYVRINVRQLMHSKWRRVPVWIRSDRGFSIEAEVLAASPPIHNKSVLNVRLTTRS